MMKPVLRRLICLQALTTAHFEIIGQRHNPQAESICLRHTLYH